MTAFFTESFFEPTTVVWLESIIWPIARISNITRNTPDLERFDHRYVIRSKSLRDSLLPKLISGEIRVKDAERIVERCV